MLYIAQDSNHNWYDFLFGSTKAHKYFTAIFTPVIIIIVVLILLCLCNCWMYRHMQTIYTTFMLHHVQSNYAYSPKQP